MIYLLLIAFSLIVAVIMSKFLGFFKFEISLSALLACLVLGAVYCNLCNITEDLMDNIDNWSKPIIVLFFVLSGAELNFMIFKNSTIIIVGLIYILARAFGKYFGVNLATNISKSEKTIKNYLGMTLLPQAGVAIGMSALAANNFSDSGLLIRNITLFGVMIYELIGPTITKIALIKAGEIKE